MIKSGALFKHKTDGGLIEIITTYDKRAIDPDLTIAPPSMGSKEERGLFAKSGKFSDHSLPAIRKGDIFA